MPSLEKGLIIGTSKGQEWLLPWWWMHYRMHNDLPVTFVDFGDLSTEALDWCSKRGTVVKLELSDHFMAKKEEVAPEKAKDWEAMHPKVWEMRFTWYKKPFTLALSPYKTTLWVDLDCQICGNLDSLFSLPLQEGGFAVIPEHEKSQQRNLIKDRTPPGWITYNAGVILYQKNAPIVQEWIDQSEKLNKEQCSDQQMLVQVLHTTSYPFLILPPEYNWTYDVGVNPKALVLHWWGTHGKEIIQRQIALMTHRMGLNFSFNDRSGQAEYYSIMKA